MQDWGGLDRLGLAAIVPSSRRASGRRDRASRRPTALAARGFAAEPPLGEAGPSEAPCVWSSYGLVLTFVRERDAPGRSTDLGMDRVRPVGGGGGSGISCRLLCAQGLAIVMPGQPDQGRVDAFRPAK